MLEVGFGLRVDSPREMIEQTMAHNKTAHAEDRIDPRHGSMDPLPFEGATFDKIRSLNSLQVWRDAMARLREIHRIMKVGGELALDFTAHSRQSSARSIEQLTAADFADRGRQKMLRQRPGGVAD